ncbi:MAG: hypothetical protein JWQ69_4996, partial [Pseudomonas sp.]|nr:hypothetical protein [Pseudomonas sp.]
RNSSIQGLRERKRSNNPNRTVLSGNSYKLFRSTLGPFPELIRPPSLSRKPLAPMKKFAVVSLMILTLLTAAMCLVALIYYDIPI